MGEIERDIGQLLWVGFHGTAAPSSLRDAIARGEVGAVVVFARNLAVTDECLDVDATVDLTESIHGAAAAGAPPPLIAVDQEGGRVQRVRAPATRWPAMLSFDRLDPAEARALAGAVGEALGAELAVLGFDVDFAPVLDVHTNPDNPVIGDRAFGTDPGSVADRALAFAAGLERAGVVPCGKHFPGHGDTSTDSHLELPRVDHCIDRLRAVELVPFVRAARAGMPMFMTAHVVFAAVDDTAPATLSPRVLREVLRGEVGFDGVALSDDLDMRAIRDHFGAAEAAVRAIESGCDALLLCADEDAQAAAREALVRRSRADAAFRARVAEAAARVRALHRRLPAPGRASAARAREVLGCARHRELAARLGGGGGG